MKIITSTFLLRKLNPQILLFSFILSGCQIFSHSFLPKGHKDFSILNNKELKDSFIYKNITVIDNREDTSSLGKLLFGFYARVYNIKNNTSLDKQIQDLANNSINKPPNDDTIVFQIRKLYFKEFIPNEFQDRIFELRLKTYKKFNNRFIPIKTIDTSIISKSNFSSLILDNRNRRLVKKARIVFKNIVIENLLSKPINEDEFYNIDQVLNINDI